MKRPILNEIPIDSIPFPYQGVTMSVGQWDGFLQNSYNDRWILLELDKEENLIHAYQKKNGWVREE